MEQSQKRQDMIKAAKLYYYGDMSQDEIAKLMGISRPKVSRLLAEARQLNIVQVSIHDNSDSLHQTAERIREHFRLHSVTVVPSGNGEDAAKSNVGRAASELLNSMLRERLKIGVSWGTTLSAFTREFKAKTPVPGALVVQLIGGTYSKNLDMDARDQVKLLAEKLQCEASLLHSPLLVSNPTLRELFMQEPAVMQHFRNVRELDVAFVGIGLTQVYQADYLTAEEAAQLRSEGFVADICGHPFLPDGSSPENILTKRIVGVTPDELRRIPSVVGLCVGNRKVPSIQAAARSGCVSTLIIDEVAAIALMAAEQLV